jgi:hypothetical protein
MQILAVVSSSSQRSVRVALAPETPFSGWCGTPATLISSSLHYPTAARAVDLPVGDVSSASGTGHRPSYGRRGVGRRVTPARKAKDMFQFLSCTGPSQFLSSTQEEATMTSNSRWPRRRAVAPESGRCRRSPGTRTPRGEEARLRSRLVVLTLKRHLEHDRSRPAVRKCRAPGRSGAGG